MAYNKTNWRDTIKDNDGNIIEKGTPLASTNLNKMEDGIANATEKAEKAEGDLVKVSQQLAETVSSTSFKSKNLMDYSDDFFTAFNMAMSDTTKSVFHLDDGTYTTPDSLVFANGKKLLCNPNTVIKTTNKDKPVFVLTGKNELVNPTIDVRGIKYTSSAILFDGVGYKSDTSVVVSPKIYGDYSIGSKAISLVSENGKSAQYNRISDVFIKEFHYGIYLSGLNTGWSNGNVFSGRIWNCTHLLYLVGESSGNNFDMMMQAGVRVGDAENTESYGIYCEGGYNTFSGFIWDIGSHSYLTNIYYRFTKSSIGNVVAVRPYSIGGSDIQDKIIDNGSRNTIGNLLPYSNMFLPPATAATDYGGSVSMVGDQDNVFAFLDKNTKGFSLTTEFSGCFEVNNSTYKPSNKFDYNDGESMLSFSDVENGFAKYTITPQTPISLSSIGVGFDSTNSEVNVKLYKNDALVAEKTLSPKKDNAFDGIYHWNLSLEKNRKNNATRGLTRIEVTFKKPSASSLFITKVFASSEAGGNTFLTKSGGAVYGDISLPVDKGIIVKTPDGTKSYRIGVDNNGTLTTVLVQ